MRTKFRKSKTSEARTPIQFSDNNSGSLTITAGLVILILSGLGLALFLRINNMSRYVKTQFYLDQCVAKDTLALKRDHKIISTYNIEIIATRAALSVTPLPPVQAALRATLASLVVLQELQRSNIKKNKILWINPYNCKNTGLSFGSFPDDPWSRPLPDSLGPQPLKWTSIKNTIKITRISKKLHSAAVITKEPYDHFEAKWTGLN